jgi:hypothetical protein
VTPGVAVARLSGKLKIAAPPVAGLDTSAGIPDGMTKAEWKKKVKEERREKCKSKNHVRVCSSYCSCFYFCYCLSYCN